MSTNLEYRARERQRKRESRWQASEAQRDKGRQRSRTRDKKQRRHFFVGRTTRQFCSGGDKMRNASGHQCKVKVSGANPGLQFCHDILCLPSYALLRDCVIILWFLFIEVKAQQYFVSSRYMFWDKNTLLKIWLNPGLNLTKFRGTGPRMFHVAVVQNNGKEMYKKSVLHVQSCFFAN